MTIAFRKIKIIEARCGDKVEYFKQDLTPLLPDTTPEKFKAPELDPSDASPLSYDTLYSYLRLLVGSKDEASAIQRANAVMNHIAWQDSTIKKLEFEIRLQKSLNETVKTPPKFNKPVDMINRTTAEMQKKKA